MNLGETLTNLRKSKGLSQEHLAEKLNLTRQTISKWELNQSSPDIDYLVELSDFFGVTTDYLIKGEESIDTGNTDVVILKTSDTEHVEGMSKEKLLHKWCLYVGGIIMGVSLIGIIAFVICSALHPWTASINNVDVEGLLGFLVGTKTLWFFILLCALFLLGCTSSVFGLVKSLKSKQ